MRIRWPKGFGHSSYKSNSNEIDSKEQELKLSYLLGNFDLDLENVSESDYKLFFRFLKARQFHVDKSTEMLKKYFEWRENRKISELINNAQIPIKIDLYQRAYHGIDRIGRPIYIDCIGSSNIKQMLEMYPEKSFFNQWIYEYEFLVNVMSVSCQIYNALRENVSGNPDFIDINKDEVMNLLNSGYLQYHHFSTLNIIDMNGFNMSKFDGNCRKVIKDLVHISQNYYPELLGKMIVINAPSIFGIIWNFLKPLIDDRTAKKISIYTHNDDWKSVLLDLVEPDQLPKFLGGSPKYEGEWVNANIGPWSNPVILECIAEKYPTIPKHLIFSHQTLRNNENIPEN
ncbi:SEC14 domain-containing protein [Cryptosporidium canis]|uniref:SEC14 domain-containing protein n=1 Tax=Cryptosporidium canis TaxID=195482 RepID=A0ABQ8PB31_9CRYT|nr:SEC14 domain-containing protein [Cryptosporidium canis]